MTQQVGATDQRIRVVGGPTLLHCSGLEMEYIIGVYYTYSEWNTLYNDILQTNVGENRYVIDRKLNEGIHIITLQQRNTQIFEKVFVSPSQY